MNSSTPGNSISTPEITHVSPHGIWLLSASGKELFLSYDDFPWFRNQPVSAIYNIQELSPGHYYWPDIDVELSESIIEKPEQYPLQSI